MEMREVMTHARLPDCRPPCRDESITSASSHPELIGGDFAMRPQSHAPLAAARRAAIWPWSRRALAIGLIVAAVLIGHSVLYQHSDAYVQSTKTEQAALAAPCMHWHQAAGEAVARLAQSTTDADLRQANDAIFRMRRGRRNCEEGWVGLACQDYYAVARRLPGYAHGEPFFACQRSAEDAGGRIRPINPPQP
jgi:hypothetical protein